MHKAVATYAVFQSMKTFVSSSKKQLEGRSPRMKHYAQDRMNPMTLEADSQRSGLVE